MKKSFCLLILSLLLVTFTSCGGDDNNPEIQIVNGNGYTSTSYVTLHPYNEVITKGNFNIIYEQSYNEEYKIHITGESNLIPYIDFRVNNGVLNIASASGVQLNTTLPIDIVLTSPSDVSFKVYDMSNVKLQHINNDKTFNVSMMGDGYLYIDSVKCEKITMNLSGTSILEANVLTSNYLNVSLNSSSKAQLHDLNVTNLEVVSAGPGDCSISGVAHSSLFRTQSSGTIKSADETFIDNDLVSKSCSILIESTGKIYVNATEVLEGKIIGAGSLYYRGDVEPNVVLSGVGKIYKLN